MRLMSALTAFAVVAMASASHAAVSPAVGEDAPAVGAVNWVMNAPEEFDGNEMKGHVTIVEYWGVKCPPCLAYIPHLSQLHQKMQSKGLRVVAIERQNHTPEQIIECVSQRNGHHPIANSGAGSYQGPGTIPFAWVIGVDGKVLFAASPNSGNLDKIVEDELAKIKYPGLGKLDVHQKLAKAAQSFVAGEYGKAREAAQKELEKVSGEAGSADEKDAAIKTDAEFIIERVTSTHGKLEGKAKGFESTKHYVKARAIYEKIILGFGKKSKEGEAADERLTAFKKDKDIKKEVKAEEELAKLDESLAKKKPEEKAKAYADFAKKNEGTQAAADALTRVKE